MLFLRKKRVGIGSKNPSSINFLSKFIFLKKYLNKYLFLDDTKIPLGKIQINSLKDLTKVGSVLSKDYREPSIFDLEDLQVPPNMAQISSNSLANLNSLISNKAHSTSNHSNFVDELTESKLQEHFANSDDENDDIEEINLEDTHSNQTSWFYFFDTIFSFG